MWNTVSFSLDSPVLDPEFYHALYKIFVHLSCQDTERTPATLQDIIGLEKTL